MEDVRDITFDPDEVQVCKSFSVVNKRMEYFLKRKREETNDRNTRLYCSPISKDCSSRTCDTISPKRRKGSECFVKKTKVLNLLVPLCDGLDLASKNSYNLSINKSSLVEQRPDVFERISNLESCLNLKTDDHNKIDIYKKLKSIEDHVLKLESILLSNGGNLSLSNIFPDDEHPGIIRNDCIKNEDINTQNKLVAEDHLGEDIKPTFKVLPKISKYIVDEIQKLINNIKRNEENTSTFKMYCTIKICLYKFYSFIYIKKLCVDVIKL